ncbi:MAG: relaxase/mobilization nuclease domain-containing protein [Bacteroidota bacterium]
MIVKILQKSETFEGVRYNTNKMEKDKGELVKISGFGALQGLEHLRPADYINYLEAISSRSKRIKFPQFHAVISCKGKSHTKEQLTGIAEQWLNGMGYGKQPYMLVFHKDTRNNHLHIVTTRIGQDGKKIDDAFEKLKSYRVLNQVMALDEKQAVDVDIETALSYSFSTRAQFMMILEAQGYALTLTRSDYKISKFGKELARIALAQVDGRIAEYQKDKDRIRQLRAIIETKRLKVDPAIYPLTRDLPGGRAATLIGYTSKLAELLKEKFGIQILFHAKDGKPPYGYTIMDHAEKIVFKGNEVITLKEFITPLQTETEREDRREMPAGPAEITGKDHRKDNTFDEDVFIEYSGDDERHNEYMPSNDASGQTDATTPVILPELQIDIADDIDDEAIHGRNRRKKRKARTNSR